MPKSVTAKQQIGWPHDAHDANNNDCDKAAHTSRTKSFISNTSTAICQLGMLWNLHDAFRTNTWLPGKHNYSSSAPLGFSTCSDREPSRSNIQRHKKRLGENQMQAAGTEQPAHDPQVAFNEFVAQANIIASEFQRLVPR